MKTLLKTLALSSLLLIANQGYAEQSAKPDMGMQHNMGNMDPAQMKDHLKAKQEHMLMMHDLSNKILAEKDPQKQQALKDQQLELMKAHQMKMMSVHHGKKTMEHQ